MDLSGPFRGSAAVAAGAVGRGALVGPRYRRLYPDTYAPRALPVNLALLSRAAHLLVEPGGILSGYSAAELLGASCGPEDAPAEVTCPWSRHPLPRLVVHQDQLAADEIVLVDGLRLTSPARTASDLVRWLDLTEGVVAVDALARRYPDGAHRVGPKRLRALRSRHLGAPGGRKLEPVLALVDPRAESPMESRMRVALVLGGVPPCVQFPVRTGGRGFRLDLAYPSVRLGVEYDGRHHLTPEQARQDLEREGLLAAAGWKIIRFGAGAVLYEPELIVERTRAEIAVRMR